MDDRLWKPSEVARYLGVSRQTVYTLIQQGDLPALQVGPGGRSGLRILDGDLRAYLESRRIKPRARNQSGNQS